MRTSDLTGAKLDYFVAMCEGKDPELRKVQRSELEICVVGSERYSPSIHWSVGGPLMEKYGITISTIPDDGFSDKYFADMQKGPSVSGPTMLLAAMRCLVKKRYGEILSNIKVKEVP